MSERFNTFGVGSFTKCIGAIAILSELYTCQVLSAVKLPHSNALNAAPDRFRNRRRIAICFNVL